MSPWPSLLAVLFAAACHTLAPDPGAGSAALFPAVSEAGMARPSAAPPGGTLPGPQAPQAAAAGTAEEGWEFLVKPYLFASGLDGTVSTGGSTTDIEADFDGLLDVLNVGGMVAFEMSPPSSRWKLLVDLIFVQLEQGGTASGPAASSADVTIDEFIGELSAAYELQDEGRLELLGGLRYWDLGVDLDANLPGGPQSASGSANWLDPLIGVRTRRKLGDRFELMLRGDVGGFGVGSQFAYNLMGELGWSFSKACQLAVGYRYLYVDYDDELTYDAAQAGPTLGLVIRF